MTGRAGRGTLPLDPAASHLSVTGDAPLGLGRVGARAPLVDGELLLADGRLRLVAALGAPRIDGVLSRLPPPPGTWRLAVDAAVVDDGGLEGRATMTSSGGRSASLAVAGRQVGDAPPCVHLSGVLALEHRGPLGLTRTHRLALTLAAVARAT